MSVNRTTASGGAAPNSNTENISGCTLATISKALSSQASWPDKEEFLDVIYWLRQIVGVLLGLVWGVVAIQVLSFSLFLPQRDSYRNFQTPPFSYIKI